MYRTHWTRATLLGCPVRRRVILAEGMPTLQLCASIHSLNSHRKQLDRNRQKNMSGPGTGSQRAGALKA
jgi:hypothetical protein